jgi:exosortase/archaeosortase family protein
MRLVVRFVLWVAAAIALSAFTAPTFPNLVNQSVGDAFGSLFVAIPIVALLTVIFAMRWKELASAMEERGLGSQVWVRAAGAAIVGALVALEPLTGQSLGASGVAVVLTFYGISLIVAPPAKRFLLPYAAVYAAAVGAPPLLLWAFGEPLATLSSGLSARLVSLAGFPVTWQGTQFEFVSKAGGLVSGVVTPSCSSVTSVTMFLGLLALMHLDMKKDVRPTLKLALLGTVALTLLNSARILIILWVGYQYGSNALLGVHDWLGYVLFLGFFLAVLPVYSKMKGPNGSSGRAPGGSSKPAGPSAPAVSRAEAPFQL